MSDAKRHFQRELFLLILIPVLVAFLGFLALWSRPISLRIMSQLMFFGHDPELARPLAERAVALHIANNDPLDNEYLWSLWTLAEIYRNDSQYENALSIYNKILAFDDTHDSQSSFMRYQVMARTSEMLHKLGRQTEATKLDQRLHGGDAAGVVH
jgi:tetratricopeptide (TPR) repeat protein